jgi:hypothetical protein
MEQINGKVKVSGEYFLKMAKADYRNYRSALWREIYQNSIDAGSTEIRVTWDEDSRSITILDNGCGMDLETLTEKLLALGGTKKGEGAVGAFGKAKELELFSWKEYMLHTHNLLLIGSGDNYTITETEDYCDGCSITLYIQEDECFPFICDWATAVARLIETNCSIFVNDKMVECTTPRGEFVRELEVGAVYVNEELPTSNYAKVRINGIWMFDHYVGEEMAHITLELSGNSIESMTSNRDGLKDGALQSANIFFRQLAADRKSALFPDKELITLRAKGTEGSKIEVSYNDIEFVETMANNSGEDFMAALERFLSVSNEDLDAALTRIRLAQETVDRWDYEQLRFFGYRWDTVHKFEKGQEREARDFLDGGVAKAKRAKTLMTLWGETLKQVMLDNRIYEEFTIGFSWDSDQQASMEKTNDGVFFYLNPKVLGRFPMDNRKRLVRKLRQYAIHEITHLTWAYHDENFVSRMQDVIDENTWKSDRVYDQIAKIRG